MTDPDPPSDPFRRRVLRALAAAPLVAAAAPAAAAPARLIAPSVCALTPELTPGPFYFDPGLLRADLAEGRPGLPVELAIQVVDAACAPIAGAVVEVWHCDAAGVYSGTRASPGTTFLRGAQPTDADGVARFRSIYPGWYPGRTPHFHFKAHYAPGRTLTSQVFMPDAVSAEVYAQPPYAARGAQGTLNARDGIARAAGAAAVAQVARRSDAMVIALVAGVAPERA